MTVILNIQHRLELTQLRTCNHQLHLESSSWCKHRLTPFDEGLCIICDRNEFEDEIILYYVIMHIQYYPYTAAQNLQHVWLPTK